MRFVKNALMVYTRAMGRSKSDVNNNIKKIIGERVRLLRGDISQGEIARRVGVAQSYLSEIEQGRKSPSLEMLLYFAKIFDTSVAFMLGENDERHRSEVAPSARPAGGDEKEPDCADAMPSPVMLLVTLQHYLSLPGCDIPPQERKMLLLLLDSCRNMLEKQCSRALS